MIWNYGKNTATFLKILSARRPFAYAKVFGDPDHLGLSGLVRFYQAPGGVLVASEFSGLPAGKGACGGKVFGFHIHEGESCTGDSEDPFKDAGGHHNPGGCAHPYHAGDMPPLFSDGGYAWMVFLTGRLTPDEILGRTVIVHSAPDDFTTQPSGNSGKKIACGRIVMS